jgi:hypothetical protein
MKMPILPGHLKTLKHPTLRDKTMPMRKVNTHSIPLTRRFKK